jgi:hypothetical protein
MTRHDPRPPYVDTDSSGYHCELALYFTILKRQDHIRLRSSQSGLDTNRWEEVNAIVYR